VSARDHDPGIRSPAAEQPLLNYFDGLYTAHADPYGSASRWYEVRKRAVLLAALPHRRYARAYAPGCGTGELVLDLCARCDYILASDFSAVALQRARERLQSATNVCVERHCIPRDWPVAVSPFDLIVISEVAPFLTTSAMELVADLAVASLAPGGVLVNCDWRHAFAERTLGAEQAQTILEGGGLARVGHYEDADFLLNVWSADARSVAEKTGVVSVQDRDRDATPARDARG
jgi:SAM-dependent methyltransferase